MKEADWLTATRPNRMLAYLHGRASARKLCLFAIACCQRHRHLFSDERSRQALATLEQFAEGIVSQQQLAEACQAAHAAGMAARAVWEAAEMALKAEGDATWPPRPALWQREQAMRECGEREAAAWLVWRLTEREWEPDEAAAQAAEFAAGVAEEQGKEAAERAVQCQLLRDLFGNPFRPVTAPASWLAWQDGAVGRLAQAIAMEGRFQDVPILGDALEEAGCTDTVILNHCRGAGPHVRGCWVVDALLTK